MAAIIPAGAMSIGQAAAPIAATAVNAAQTLAAAYEAAPNITSAAVNATGSAAKGIFKFGKNKMKSQYKKRPRTAPSAKTSTRQFGQVTDGGNEPIPQGTLVADPIQFPPQGADVGLRLGTTIKLSGIKLCERIVNSSDVAISLHYAIVQAKEPNLTNIKSQFFRDTQVDPALTTNTRTTNFSDAFAGQAYPFYQDCYPINPDKFWVITHIKKRLGPKEVFNDGDPDFTSFTNRTPGSYTWSWEKYINFKRKRLVFTSANDTTPEHNIYRCIWWYPLDSADWDSEGKNPADVIIGRMKDGVIYFTNGFA